MARFGIRGFACCNELYGHLPVLEGFRALRAMKGLRRTPLDPFGHAEVRRVERELIGEYRAILKEACAKLTPRNHAAAVALAELPDMVRGYEQIKLDNVHRYREAARQLLAQLD